MKTKPYLQYFFAGNLTWFFFLVFLFPACKKDAVIDKTVSLPAFKTLSAKSDGIITVQTGILPPVTQQTFIITGGSSTAEFQIVSSQHIFLYELYFSATFPLIEYITIKNYGVGNVGGSIEFNSAGDIDAGSGSSFYVQIHYSADSNVSGATAQLNLTNIIYRTDDEKYHSFFPDNAGKAQTMCVVNNIPHITFIDPAPDSLNNGFKEIAAIKLTGDTDWILNALPLNLLSPFDAVISKAKLIVKNRGKTIHIKTDSVALQPGCTAQTVINFIDGFIHRSHTTDMLKIYAPVSGTGYNLITTTMSPLSSFVWTDRLGVKLNGIKNDKFYKEQTGQSHYY